MAKAPETMQLRRMRLLQLSDLHLLADPTGLCRGRRPLVLLRQALEQSLRQLRDQGDQPDLLLLSGDLCQDESWLGYVRLRELLAPLALPVALLPGNHDHALLLRAALARHWPLAPAVVPWGGAALVLLDSHRPGSAAGWLGERQLAWLARQLADWRDRPLVVALHHPPLAIGDPGFDAIGLDDGPALLELLASVPSLKAVLFGHIHQHWRGTLPSRGDVPLLGCPSTLCSFGPVQPCPLGRAGDPGGRLVVLEADGRCREQLLRWPAPDASSVAASR